MFSTLEILFKKPNKNLKKEIKELKEMEDYTDQMEEQLSQYLVSCSQENISGQSLINVNEMIRITSEIENIGDSCFNLVLLCQRRYDKKISLPQKGEEEILDYFTVVKKFLSFNATRLIRSISEEEYEMAFQLEKTVNKYRNALKKSSRKRLKKGSPVRTELLFIDMVKHMEHIGDHSLTISQSLRRIR
jgi:phosphate:Na+ symporter